MTRALVVRGGPLLDGIADAPIADGAVVVTDGRISWVGRSTNAPAGGADLETIDTHGAVIMPGLIDCHTHISFAVHLSLLDLESRHSLERATITAVANARTILFMGYTTIRDVGSRGAIACAVRDAIADGIISGPRILAGGPIVTTTGGLADFLPSWVSTTQSLGLVADGVDEVRKAVRKLVKMGVDIVKFDTTGHAISRAGGMSMSTMSEEEITAGVREAHRYGKRVAAHAQSRAGILNALRGGVDTLEHGSELDEESIELLRQGRTILVPTISNLYSYTEQGRKIGVKDSIIAEVERSAPAWIRSLGMAREAGVPIAMGGDVGNRYPNGQNSVELEMLVRHGFTPVEAINAATRVSSQALGLDAETGTLEVGKAADIIAVGPSPLGDIRVLQDASSIKLVMRGGRVEKKTLD